jgi:hypothetical protein
MPSFVSEHFWNLNIVLCFSNLLPLVDDMHFMYEYTRLFDHSCMNGKLSCFHFVTKNKAVIEYKLMKKIEIQ